MTGSSEAIDHQLRVQLDELAPELLELSHTIHELAEVAYDEHASSAALVEFLQSHGVSTERGGHGLATSFEARHGEGSLDVAICAEYDALPGLGHACGHNIIAAAAVGAFLLLRDHGGPSLRLRLLGCPAEERGGGKIAMLDQGAFDGAHFAVMVHPGHQDVLMPEALAMLQVEVEFEGRPSHAAAAPDKGRNAADAMVLSQVAIGLLRQQLPPGIMVHGVVRESGDAPNIIPSHAAGTWYVRAPTIAALEDVLPRFEACFTGAAQATQTAVTLTSPHGAYAELVHDLDLARHFAASGGVVGRSYELRPGERLGSTDFGNVSMWLPSIHPVVGLGPESGGIHRPEFADAAMGPRGDQAVIDSAFMLASTVYRVAADLPTVERLVSRGARTAVARQEVLR